MQNEPTCFNLHLGMVLSVTVFVCVRAHMITPSYWVPILVCGLFWGGSHCIGMFHDTRKTSIMSEAHVIWQTMIYGNYLPVKWGNKGDG